MADIDEVMPAAAASSVIHHNEDSPAHAVKAVDEEGDRGKESGRLANDLYDFRLSSRHAYASQAFIQ